MAAQNAQSISGPVIKTRSEITVGSTVGPAQSFYRRASDSDPPRHIIVLE